MLHVRPLVLAVGASCVAVASSASAQSARRPATSATAKKPADTTAASGRVTLRSSGPEKATATSTAPARRGPPVPTVSGPIYALAIGATSGGLGCAVCRNTSNSAASVSGSAAWPVAARLSAGVEGLAWLHVFGSGADQTALGVSGVARWQPWPARPVAITGGVGILSHRIDDGTLVLTSRAALVSTGASYDLPLRGGVWVTPQLTLRMTSPTSLVAANGIAFASDARLGFATFGVGLTWF